MRIEAELPDPPWPGHQSLITQVSALDIPPTAEHRAWEAAGPRIRGSGPQTQTHTHTPQRRTIANISGTCSVRHDSKLFIPFISFNPHNLSCLLCVASFNSREKRSLRGSE